MKKLTIAQVKEIAMKYYEQGGDSIIECYDDGMIQEWIERDGTEEELYRLFGLRMAQITEHPFDIYEEDKEEDKEEANDGEDNGYWDEWEQLEGAYNHYQLTQGRG